MGWSVQRQDDDTVLVQADYQILSNDEARELADALEQVAERLADHLEGNFRRDDQAEGHVT
jgi:antitoxin component of MazEF toxin-antitoxin module